MSLKQIDVQLCSHWGTDRNAAEAAWASSMNKDKAEARTQADVARVVTGLVHMGHDTPKERVWMEFFITCPIFIERQFDKYRMTVQYQDFQVDYLAAPFGRDGITQNELSGRYRTIPDRPYELPADVANILGKVAFHNDRKHPNEHWYTDVEDAACIEAKRFNDRVRMQHVKYQNKLTQLRDAEKEGVITNAEYKRAREVLRGELGTSYLTDMRVVMNLNAFEHIVAQRLAKDAQMESRVVAYHMVKAAQAAAVAPTLVAELIKAKGWEPLLLEVEAALAA